MDLAAGMFSFELLDAEGNSIETVFNDADGSFAFSEIAYTLDDVGEPIVYTVREVQGDIAGVEYDETEYEISVTVSDSGDGTLDVAVSGSPDALVFTNTYEANGKVRFSGSKTLSGKALTKGMFSFELLDAEDNSIETVFNDADGSFAFSEIAYTLDDVGKPLTYKVREVDGNIPGVTYDDTIYTVTVEVSDNGDGKLNVTTSANAYALNFTNTYKATGSVTFAGTKSLTGRALTEQDVFQFSITDGKDTWTAASDASGTISYPVISYTLSDVGTHTYTVCETSENGKGITVDETTYTVTVTVSDNGDGTLNVLASDNAQALNFVNTYEAAASLLLNAIKTVNGGEPTDEQVYDFICESEDGVLAAQNVNGNITFGSVYFTLEDVGKTFTYTIRETTASTDTLIADESVYTVTLTVIDNGDGTLAVNPVITKDGADADGIVFDNLALAPLTISKTVTGAQTGKAYDVTVTLYDAEGAELADTYEYTGDLSGEIVSGGVISLAHGQSVTIAGIPQGTRYVVEEAQGPSYTTMVNSEEGSKAEGMLGADGALVDFVNDVEATSFRVTKIWEGGQDSDIVLTLYADGMKLNPQPAYIREGSDYVYNNLPMYSETGEFIVYSAKEKGVEGYITIYNNIFPYADVTRSIHDGGTIINRPAKELSFKVQKVWNGLEPGETPPAIVLTLYCNGVKMNTATPSPDGSGWYKYYNLPKLVDGKPAVYTVIEEPVTGFAAHYEDANGLKAEYGVNGGRIINTRIPKTGDDSSLALWMILMSASTSAMALLILRRRKA